MSKWHNIQVKNDQIVGDLYPVPWFLVSRFSPQRQSVSPVLSNLGRILFTSSVQWEYNGNHKYNLNFFRHYIKKFILNNILHDAKLT